MKEKLTLRNVILWTAALVLLILFLVSFGARAKLSAVIEGYPIAYVFKHIIWGCDYAYATGEGGLSIPSGFRAVSVPGIIGALLFLLAAGGLVVCSLLIKNEKLRKILIFVCAGAILFGSALMFFVQLAAWKQMATIMETSVDAAKAQLKQMGFKASSGYGVGAGIVGILFAAAVVGTQTFIPEVKFIKSK